MVVNFSERGSHTYSKLPLPITNIKTNGYFSISINNINFDSIFFVY